MNPPIIAVSGLSFTTKTFKTTHESRSDFSASLTSSLPTPPSSAAAAAALPLLEASGHLALFTSLLKNERTLLGSKPYPPVSIPDLPASSVSSGSSYQQTKVNTKPSDRPFSPPSSPLSDKNEDNLDDHKRPRPNADQMTVLWKAFNENPMPSAAVRQKLAAQLDMSPRAVQIWFQNRRQWFRTKGVKDMNSLNGPSTVRKNGLNVILQHHRHQPQTTAAQTLKDDLQSLAAYGRMIRPQPPPQRQSQLTPQVHVIHYPIQLQQPALPIPFQSPFSTQLPITPESSPESEEEDEDGNKDEEKEETTSITPPPEKPKAENETVQTESEPPKAKKPHWRPWY